MKQCNWIKLLWWQLLSYCCVDGMILKVYKRTPPTTTTTGTPKDCSRTRLELCLKPIAQLTQDDKLAFPVNQVELNETCRVLQTGNQCTEQYFDQCTTKQMNSMLWDLIRGTKNVLRLLCQDGSIQNDYLLHAKCFKQIALTSCLPVLKQFQQLSTTGHEWSQSSQIDSKPGQSNYAHKFLLLNGKTSDSQTEQITLDRQLHNFCCGYKATIDCQLASIERDCGERWMDAVRFFRHYTHQMANSLLTEHCLTFTYSGGCGMVATSLPHPPPQQTDNLQQTRTKTAKQDNHPSPNTMMILERVGGGTKNKKTMIWTNSDNWLANRVKQSLINSKGGYDGAGVANSAADSAGLYGQRWQWWLATVGMLWLTTGMLLAVGSNLSNIEHK